MYYIGLIGSEGTISLTEHVINTGSELTTVDEAIEIFRDMIKQYPELYLYRLDRRIPIGIKKDGKMHYRREEVWRKGE